MNDWATAEHKRARRGAALKFSALQAALVVVLWLIAPGELLRHLCAALAFLGLGAYLAAHYLTDRWWPHGDYAGPEEEAPPLHGWVWAPAPDAHPFWRPASLCGTAAPFMIAALLLLCVVGYLPAYVKTFFTDLARFAGPR
ncbi:MAG: hypothetical protein ABIJ96_11230 [Elusimicrobiota bacterium]